MKNNTQVGKYKIVALLHKGYYFADYRVIDENGIKHYMRLINPAKLHDLQLMPGCDQILELTMSQGIVHPNIARQSDTGEIIVDGQRYLYIVRDFFPGELLSDKLDREAHCSIYEVHHIISGVLNALKFLHNQSVPLIYNHIDPEGILLDISKQEIYPILNDFGHARHLNKENHKPYIIGLPLFYMAPELLLRGIYSTRSDLYAVGALMYHLIFGMEPWEIDLNDTTEPIKDVLEARKTPLPIPNLNIFELDDNLLRIMAKALAQDVDDRFQNAEEFLAALNGLTDVKCDNYQRIELTSKTEEHNGSIKKSKGNGFADVAGMTELKQRLQEDVIDLLRHPEKYQKLRVKIPNGMLLYGPPGCGKTFIAEKFAEELGCNFIKVDCSDIASPYIHGGQSKIAELFKEAAKNAPTILFLDELEAMITDRSRHTNISEQGEVNVFLTQLNNCSERGIFVIGATNKPDMIDPAALRAGRLDIKVYVPAPDKEGRKEILKLALHNRCASNIDYDILAKETTGYVSADITEMINQAAITTVKNNGDTIMMDTLMETIKNGINQWPSVTAKQLQEYEDIRERFESKKTLRRSVGFISSENKP
ncbi:MAG: AAA family ATPase [Bacteroidales bacterium]|nr:AAA family ATPase [Bacteroidales bacterium]